MDHEHPVADITQILRSWNDGSATAREELLRVVYDDLKRRARFMMSNEREGHTLQPTALVHEAYLKLTNGADVEWKDRAHFYGVMSHLMREILVDHARRFGAVKRGSGWFKVSIDDVDIPVEVRATSILGIDVALRRLSAIDERQASIVEMRFFGGLTNNEIAELLGINERSVRRDWQLAKLWLYRELRLAVE